MQNNQLRITCPQCGFGVYIDPSRKFVCKCGYTSLSGDQIPPRIISQLESDRIKICEGCENYNNYRCKNIDLGCRITFLEVITNNNTSCPLHKW
jgi:endogenous inhibitor of DNA gyrase (YacG/DUF329 family)